MAPFKARILGGVRGGDGVVISEIEQDSGSRCYNAAGCEREAGEMVSPSRCVARSIFFLFV